jgi:hypothetical protein
MYLIADRMAVEHIEPLRLALGGDDEQSLLAVDLQVSASGYYHEPAVVGQIPLDEHAGNVVEWVLPPDFEVEAAGIADLQSDVHHALDDGVVEDGTPELQV